MKTTQLKAKKNRELVCKIIGIDPNTNEFELLKIHYFQKYVTRYAEDNASIMLMLMNSEAFSAWWTNVWNVNNWRLVNKYSLPSYQNRVKQGLPVRITAWGFRQQFDRIHSIDPCRLYPDTAITQLMRKEERN